MLHKPDASPSMPFYKFGNLMFLKKICTPPDIVKEAHASLVEQLSLLYVTLTETLATQQLCYLNALLAGETSITSAETMNRYGISSSTSASRSKAALIKGDVLDNEAGKLSFQDPIYAWWLKHCYFR